MSAALVYAAVGLLIGAVTWLIVESNTLMPRRERWMWTVGVGALWLLALVGLVLYAVALLITAIIEPLVRPLRRRIT